MSYKFYMKVIKKNQLAILVISLMLITAGYLNYDASQSHNANTVGVNPDESTHLASIGDAELVNANVTNENSEGINTNVNQVTDDKENNAISNNVNSKETSNGVNANESNITTEASNQENESNLENSSSLETSTDQSDYFEASKLERNIMYSQMIERYQVILNSSSEMAQEKTIAQQEINKINELQNAIMIAENLLTTKGFSENIIFVNGDSISVIIGKKELSPEEVAQVQNIISRELKAEVSNIHISLK